MNDLYITLRSMTEAMHNFYSFTDNSKVDIFKEQRKIRFVKVFGAKLEQNYIKIYTVTL